MITRIGNRELGLLCERVGIAFDVGHDPFRIFEREAGDGRTRHGRHMKSIADRIRQGASLTEAIHEQGNYFPPNFHRLIEVGKSPAGSRRCSTEWPITTRTSPSCKARFEARSFGR